MSERQKLIAGAVIVLILAWLAANAGLNVVTRQSEYPTPLFPENTTMAQIAGWWLTISVIAIVLLTAWTATKAYERVKALTDRFSVQATIPGYFIVALLPAGMGMVLMILTGQTTWGCWLSCLSLPATALFLWIALRAIPK